MCRVRSSDSVIKILSLCQGRLITIQKQPLIVSHSKSVLVKISFNYVVRLDSSILDIHIDYSLILIRFGFTVMKIFLIILGRNKHSVAIVSFLLVNFDLHWGYS